MRIVLGSNNRKKLAELAALLGGLPLQLVAQGELGIAEAAEPYSTFVENALAKARHAAAHSGEPAIADDSGLCVEALGGAPGVVSAVYAGSMAPLADREAHRAAQDAANNALLLEHMAGMVQRRGAYIATLVALRDPDDPQPLIAMGRWDGEILEAARGQGGFGYDPLLFIPALGKTVAELDSATKNAHSHRAVAARRMLELLREAWRLD